MAGQTISDRLLAARHSIAGQGLAKAVCKATTEEMIGPKKKHLDCKFFGILNFMLRFLSSFYHLEISKIPVFNSNDKPVTWSQLHIYIYVYTGICTLPKISIFEISNLKKKKNLWARLENPNGSLLVLCFCAYSSFHLRHTCNMS